MLYLKSFTFNPFQQNTYLVYNDALDAFIIDPGNYTASENKILSDFIAEKGLKLKRLLLTHGHIDHVLGNKYIYETYDLLPEIHQADEFFINSMTQTGNMYGVPCEQSPSPKAYINEGDIISLGEYGFECIFTPGHSPGSISFYNASNKLLISGDVLFLGSIGRTDLPMGDHETLLKSVREKLFVLPDDVKVYSGHGPATTIGHEKSSNPFF